MAEQPTLDPKQRLHELQRLEELVGNVLTSRKEFFSQFLDPRRNIDDECGYPQSSGTINPSIYQELFDREAIAARVVEVLPRETWQVQPLVYEDESSDISTPFEEAWDNLAQQLRGEQSYFKDDEGHPVWEYLRRADELSGIGHFGIILLGLDDGKDLREPVDGMEIGTPNAPGDSVGFFGSGGSTNPIQGANPSPYSGSIQGADVQYFQSSTTTLPGNLPQGTYDTPNTPQLASEQSRPSGMEEDTGGSMSSDTSSGNRPGDTGSKPPGNSSIPQKDSGRDEGIGGEEDTSTPSKGKRKLLYLRVFPESLVQITQYESRPSSPRFGQPVMYLVTLNDPREQHSGVGLPIASMNVHWTRVVHIADTQHQSASSEVFGIPRMRPVLNRILDLRKLYGSSAEGYYRSGFPGMSFETHPQLGGDVEINKAELRDMYEEYSNGLQRVLMLMGMSAKTLSPSISDPTTYIEIQITAICIKIDCPKRVFMGSERGELASSQDDQAWNDTLRERQKVYVTPRIIVPFIDRLIAVGVLPKPNVRKPAPQMDKPFALAKAASPTPPTHAIGPDGTPMPLVGGSNGAGGTPGGMKGQPPPAAGTFPPKPSLTPPGNKPAFPPKPSFNRLIGNAPFPPKRAPTPVDDTEDPSNPLLSEDGTDESSSDSFGQSDSPDQQGASSPLGPIGPDGKPQLPPQKPEKPGYRIDWPDLTSQSDSEKATIANTRTTALGTYISGGVDALVPPLEFLTKIMGIPEDESRSIIDAAAKAQEDAKAQDEADASQQAADQGANGMPPNQPPGASSQPSAISPQGPGGSPFPPKLPTATPTTPPGIMPKSPLLKE